MTLQMNKRLKAIAVLFSGLILAFLVFPHVFLSPFGQEVPSAIDKEFSLGLDLKGGTHLIYRADMSEVPGNERAQAMEGIRDVIERRINAFGIAEPVVQINQSGQEWRLIVELAGISDVNQAIQMIGETPLLEFKEYKPQPTRDLTPEEQEQLEQANIEIRAQADELFAKAQENPQDFSNIIDTTSNVINLDPDSSEAVVDFSLGLDQKEKYENLGLISQGGPYDIILESIEDVNEGEIAPGLIIDKNGDYSIVKVNSKSENPDVISASHILVCHNESEQGCEAGRTKEEALARAQEIKQDLTTENFAQKALELSDEAIAKQSQGNLGFFSRETMVEPFANAAFDLNVGDISDVVETKFGYHIIYKTGIQKQAEVERLFIPIQQAEDIIPVEQPWQNTELSGKHLNRATVDFQDITQNVVINLEFNEEGTKLFADITERNLNERLGIYLDGQSIIDTNQDGIINQFDIYAPEITTVIKDGRAIIQGIDSIEEAKTITSRLNSGALPVPIELINQQTVGATLGAESVQKSLKAGIVGLIVVMVFMILYYRLAGLLSVLSLVMYSLMMLALFKFLGITLTLAGLAGFILSIGMAVDANVLIFERLKEELGNGKPLLSAINDAFKRAWTAIRDGNISTLLTCIILTWFGTSIIKGFAITLGIGVIVSMFSAIIITKTFMYAFGLVDIKKYGWLYLVKKND